MKKKIWKSGLLREERIFLVKTKLEKKRKISRREKKWE
jgi:hypothetical protein